MTEKNTPQNLLCCRSLREWHDWLTVGRAEQETGNQGESYQKNHQLCA